MLLFTMIVSLAELVMKAVKNSKKNAKRLNICDFAYDCWIHMEINAQYCLKFVVDAKLRKSTVFQTDFCSPLL